MPKLCIAILLTLAGGCANTPLLRSTEVSVEREVTPRYVVINQGPERLLTASKEGTREIVRESPVTPVNFAGGGSIVIAIGVVGVVVALAVAKRVFSGMEEADVGRQVNEEHLRETITDEFIARAENDLIASFKARLGWTLTPAQVAERASKQQPTAQPASVRVKISTIELMESRERYQKLIVCGTAYVESRGNQRTFETCSHEAWNMVRERLAPGSDMEAFRSRVLAATARLGRTMAEDLTNPPRAPHTACQPKCT